MRQSSAINRDDHDGSSKSTNTTTVLLTLLDIDQKVFDVVYASMLVCL